MATACRVGGVPAALMKAGGSNVELSAALRTDPSSSISPAPLPPGPNAAGSDRLRPGIDGGETLAQPSGTLALTSGLVATTVGAPLEELPLLPPDPPIRKPTTAASTAPPTTRNGNTLRLAPGSRSGSRTAPRSRGGCFGGAGGAGVTSESWIASGIT